jgi:hypothetical protein
MSFSSWSSLATNSRPVSREIPQRTSWTPFRKALVVDDDAARRQALLDRVYVDDTKVPMPVDVDMEKERWDCETILSESLAGRSYRDPLMSN